MNASQRIVPRSQKKDCILIEYKTHSQFYLQSTQVSSHYSRKDQTNMNTDVLST